MAEFAYEDVNDQCRRFRHPSDTAWLLTSSFKILAMQAGFAVLESSFIREKNSANIMMKNVADLCTGVIVWWVCGWALAYGVDPNDPDNHNAFLGTGSWFLIDSSDYADWLFQLVFASTAATIDSGAVAERMNFKPYVFYSIFLTGWVYPLVCHWCWDEHGWLTKMGFYDFAGSGPVHLLGGTSALAAAWYIGPRTGRFARHGDLEVEIIQGENLGKQNTASTNPAAPDSHDHEAEQGARYNPYIIVQQRTHGHQAYRTRHAETMSHPRWNVKMRFKVRALDKVKPSWQEQFLAWRNRKAREGYKKKGRVRVHTSEDGQLEDDRFVCEVLDHELPPALREPAIASGGGVVSGQVGHVASASSPPAPSSRSRSNSNSGDGGPGVCPPSSQAHSPSRITSAPVGSSTPAADSGRGGTSGRLWLPSMMSMSHSEAEPHAVSRTPGDQFSRPGAVTYDDQWCGLTRKGLEFRDREGGHLRSMVGFEEVWHVSKWQLDPLGLTVSLINMHRVEMRANSNDDRDAWFNAICKAWRPQLTPISLRFSVMDHISGEVLGCADLDIETHDKPDPHKFAVSSMLRVSCGGRLEVLATYTSAERMTREIFQAWDPSKLLFGTVLLWVSWFSFNTGSTGGAMEGGAELAAKVAMTTALASSAGAASSMVYSELATAFITVETISTGALGSLVSITAGCSLVGAGDAVIIGVIGALLSNLAIKLLEKLKIDDPCGAFAVHGAAGLWGIVAVGLFAEPEHCTGVHQHRGLFKGGGWKLLGVQCLGLVAIVAWTAANSLIFLKSMDFLSRRMRVLRWMAIRPSKAVEQLGFDQSEHNIHRVQTVSEPLMKTHAQDHSVHTVAKRSWQTIRKRLHNLTPADTANGDQRTEEASLFVTDVPAVVGTVLPEPPAMHGSNGVHT